MHSSRSHYVFLIEIGKSPMRSAPSSQSYTLDACLKLAADCDAKIKAGKIDAVHTPTSSLTLL